MPTPPRLPFYDGRHYIANDSVGHQLARLMQTMRREVETRMVEHGLTDAQWKPLWLLDSGRATTANELAREMDVDAGAITRAVDRLEAKGLVERLRSDTDRRVVQLRLTEAGRAAASQVPQVLASANNDFLRGFSRAEYQQLRGFLERLQANGDAMQKAQASA